MAIDFRQLRVPVICAPMAGGVNTPALAAAVTNAGGVGSFGFAYSTPEKIASDLVATRQLTKGPINANFFVFSPVTPPSELEQQAAVSALKALPYADQCDLQLPAPPYSPDLDQQLDPIWRLRPEILTFHFGLPSPGVFRQAKSLGISVGITVTSVAEALAVEHAGADFVIAQGIEAGGHRGTFDIHAQDEALELDALLRQLVANISLPIVAAGGVMDGSGVRRVLNAGASAAQMGTAFLGCSESGASPAHKAYISQERARGTVLTKGFSGRWARGIHNEFIARMQEKLLLPFPIQNTLTGPIRALAVKRNDGEYQSLWAGVHYGKARSMPAAQLMAALAREIGESSAQVLDSDEVAIEMLYACHDRVERQCATLLKLVSHLASYGCDKSAQQASASVLRYFNQAAPDHHADEERDLFPALLGAASSQQSSEIPELIQRLVKEHRLLEGLWVDLSAELTRIAQGQHASLDKDKLDLFLKTYREHIDLENNVLFPKIKACLTEPQIAAIGKSMRLRRGIDSFE